MKIKFHEKVSRSITKAVTYRALIILTDSVVVYLVTHRVDLTFGVVVLSNISSSFVYVFHERLWNKVHWGKEKK